jgi:hypothetical protein
MKRNSIPKNSKSASRVEFEREFFGPEVLVVHEDFETVKSASTPPVNRRKCEVETTKLSLGQKILTKLTLWEKALQIEMWEADRSNQK